MDFLEISSRLINGQGLVKTLLLCLLLSSCSGFFYQPIQGALFSPERVGLKEEEVWLKSADGVKLHGWAFRASEKKGTVLLFHGNAENMSSHFLNLVWLIKEGYDLLVFDYRGYGFSEGIPDQHGIYYDALAAMDWAYHDHLKRETKQLIVFGQSLGGQISARALPDFKHQGEVDLFVMDSTFGSYQQMANRKMRDVWLLWPFSPLAYVGFSDEYASYKVLNKIAVPVLGLHAPEDPVVSYELGRKAHQLIKSKKWWWPVSGGKHTDAFHLPQTPFRQKFLELLSRL